MKKFVITADSNCDLSEEYIKENEIGIIPHYYDLGGVVYGGRNELGSHEFYDRMRQGVMPTTMASNPAVIIDTFQKYIEQGYDILHISFSSALSGGCSNVMAGAREIQEEFPGSNVVVIDTLNVSLGEGMVVMKAREMQKEGKSLKETVEWLEGHKQEFCVLFTVDDLFHLSRGGRISKATAVVGSAIGMKPILYVNSDGELVSLSMARGRKKSLTVLTQNMEARMGIYKEKGCTIGIVHGDSLEDAKYLEKLIIEKFDPSQIIINTVSPSIGAHSGPGAIGVCFMGEKR